MSGRCAWFFTIGFVLTLSLSVSTPAAEWTHFRGSDGSGLALGISLPTEWSEDSNIEWKSAVPGRGWSSPVGNDQELWVTAAVQSPATPEQREKLIAKQLGNPMAKEMEYVGAISLRAICLDPATGKIVHDVELFKIEEPEPVHSLNSYASPTPIWAPGRLYCHFGTFGTAAVDTTTGKVLWSTRIKQHHSVGPGSSPLLYGNKLIIPCDGTTSQFITALNTADGEQVWKTKRPKMTGLIGDLQKAFSTPLLVNHDGQDQVVIPGAQWFASYHPETGKELWRVRHGDGFSNVPAPVAGHGMVYLCTGYMRPQLWAIKLGGTGDITETHVAWKATKGIPNMPSPILVGNEIYAVSDQGIVTCWDALTGEQHWQQRVGGNYSSSPLSAQGLLYLCSREGDCHIVKASTTYELVATNKLDGQLMASPSVVDNTLFLRSQSHIYRLKHGNATGK